MCCFGNNCCARAWYRLTKKSHTKSKETTDIQPNKEENWGDWDDIEAPSRGVSAAVAVPSHESIPFIHPNTITNKREAAAVAPHGALLKAKAGWVVKEKKKKKKTNYSGSVTAHNSDPFSGMGMTANYTDTQQKIQPKKLASSANLGGGARSLEEDTCAYEDDGGWGNDDEDEI